MTLEELKQTAWYIGRPPVIQQAIDKMPPFNLYRFKDSGKQCYIYSYEEPESNLLDDVTVTVQKVGAGGVLEDLGLGKLDTNMVFGIKLDDLEDVNQT